MYLFQWAEISQRHKEMKTQDLSSVYCNLIWWWLWEGGGGGGGEGGGGGGGRGGRRGAAAAIEIVIDFDLWLLNM